MQKSALSSLALFATCGLIACGPAAEESVEIVSTSEAVINHFEVAGEKENGISAGFNLDGLVSDDHDGRSCYQEDFTTADGEEGIDNALAKLLPLIDLAGEGALEGLLQQSINEGRLLMIFKMEERSDGNYNVSLLRGNDVPMLGTDGLLLSGQTLALHEEPQLGYFENAVATGNIIRAGPMKMHLPVVVFNVLYEVDMSKGYFEFELTEDGNIKQGRLAGAVSMEQVMELAENASQRTHGLEDLLAGGVSDAADLDRDENGKCQSLSMAITFSGVPGFTF